jgi:hypothetical protein
MSLLLPLVFLLVQAPAAAPQELEGPHRNEAYDFEIGLPKGWETLAKPGAALFRLQAPAGTMADGTVWLLHHDSNHPVTLAFLTDTFRTKAATEYPGYKSLTERDVMAGTHAARQIVFSAKAKGDKELVFVHTLIQRQLQEYFILDVVGAVGEKERALALSDKMLASFRSGLPPPQEREERIARTLALLKDAPPRPAFAGTLWHELLVANERLGWQKCVLREAKVDGAPGWEFELECRQEDADGGRRSDISKGAFTLDGSIQRVEYRRTVTTPKDPPVDCRESASLVRGVCKATRRYLDQKEEKEFKAPGAYLGDIAGLIRRWLALAPAGKNAIRVLEPFRDLPAVEEWENGGPSRIRLDGNEMDLIHARVTHGRQDFTDYFFDLDGSLRKRKGPRGIVVLRRCTEEEALRK